MTPFPVPLCTFTFYCVPMRYLSQVLLERLRYRQYIIQSEFLHDFWNLPIVSTINVQCSCRLCFFIAYFCRYLQDNLTCKLTVTMRKYGQIHCKLETVSCHSDLYKYKRKYSACICIFHIMSYLIYPPHKEDGLLTLH